MTIMTMLLFSGSLAWGSLTLDKILDSVDRHYPEIEAADAQARAADSLVMRARGAFDPNLVSSYSHVYDGSYKNEGLAVGLTNQIPGTPAKVGVKWDRSNGKIPVYEGDRETGSDGRIKAYIDLPLMRDFVIDRSRAGIESALFRHAESLERSRLARLNTYRLAALGYWSWLAAVEKQRSYEALLAAVRERDSAIMARVKRGELPRIDHIDNQRILMQRQAQLEKARLEVQKAALNLSLFYRDENGLPRKMEIGEAPAWLKPLEGDSAKETKNLRANLAQHPVVMQLEQAMKQRSVDRKLTKYGLLPALNLSLSQSQYMGELPTARDQAYESAIGLNLTFPLLNREARGGAEAARLEEAAAESRLVLARQKLDVEFDESLLESETANQIYKLIFNEAQFASQVELAERKRFKQGDSALINVNMREQDAILARIRAIDALFDVEDRLLELKLLTNSWIRKY